MDLPCREGEVCLEARCYPACTADSECAAPHEACVKRGSDRGACVAQTAELAPDPCDALLCTGATPACNSRAGQCVACVEDSHCASAASVCDHGTGHCVQPSPDAACAPCNRDEDCRGGAGAAKNEQLSCVSVGHIGERVCVEVGCLRANGAAACPPGFECLPSLDACVPRRGSCTAYRAAELGQDCVRAEDCSPLGVAADSPFAGICHDGTCAIPCGATLDCPGNRSCLQAVCRSEGEPLDAGLDAAVAADAALAISESM